MVIIIGEFKDTKQKFFINELNKTDSLRRTLLEENATIFKSRLDAQKYVERIKKECHRFNECTFSFSNKMTKDSGIDHEQNI